MRAFLLCVSLLVGCSGGNFTTADDGEKTDTEGSDSGTASAETSTSVAGDASDGGGGADGGGTPDTPRDTRNACGGTGGLTWLGIGDPTWTHGGAFTGRVGDCCFWKEGTSSGRGAVTCVDADQVYCGRVTTCSAVDSGA